MDSWFEEITNESHKTKESDKSLVNKVLNELISDVNEDYLSAKFYIVYF